LSYCFFDGNKENKNKTKQMGNMYTYIGVHGELYMRSIEGGGHKLEGGEQ